MKKKMKKKMKGINKVSIIGLIIAVVFGVFIINPFGLIVGLLVIFAGVTNASWL